MQFFCAAPPSWCSSESHSTCVCVCVCLPQASLNSISRSVWSFSGLCMIIGSCNACIFANRRCSAEFVVQTPVSSTCFGMMSPRDDIYCHPCRSSFSFMAWRLTTFTAQRRPLLFRIRRATALKLVSLVSHEDLRSPGCS